MLSGAREAATVLDLHAGLLDSEGVTTGESPRQPPCLSAAYRPAHILPVSWPLIHGGERKGRGSFEKACMSLASHLNSCNNKKHSKSIAERRYSSNSVSVHAACLTAECGTLGMKHGPDQPWSLTSLSHVWP